jgi:hypothetical protein
MNNKDTHELIEIVDALQEFIARRGHDETPESEHAKERNSETMYNTRKLANTFLELEREGYNALSFGLVVDLINRDCVERVGK